MTDITEHAVVGIRAQRRPPRAYLAGKISKYLHWRYAALGDLTLLDPHRQIHPGLEVDELEEALDPAFFLAALDHSFTIVGPFFVGCDHGCSHGLSMHATVGCSELHRDVEETRARVLAVNLSRIERADFVFAHIDETDCCGTLVEIGFARGADVPVHLHFGSSLTAAQRDEMWFAAGAASYRHEGVDVRTAFKNALRSRGSGPPPSPRTIADLLGPSSDVLPD
jgi:hypothetical protein